MGAYFYRMIIVYSMKQNVGFGMPGMRVKVPIGTCSRCTVVSMTYTGGNIS